MRAATPVMAALRIERKGVKGFIKKSPDEENRPVHGGNGRDGHRQAKAWLGLAKKMDAVVTERFPGHFFSEPLPHKGGGEQK
jgi:hypothetical protein